MNISKAEYFELAKSWALVTLVFAIASAQGISELSAIEAALFIVFLTVMSAVCAGLGFLLHELAHRAVARHYGLVAEYRAGRGMGMISIIAAFAGWIILAPGAVYIRGEKMRPHHSALIAAAGPAANLVIALVFFSLSKVTFGLLAFAASFGFYINSWLALFNLVPAPGFDGSKIIGENPLLFLGLASCAVYMVFFV